MVTFLELPDALNRQIASYFPKHKEALPRIASTCHYCRKVYTSHVTVLKLSADYNWARQGYPILAQWKAYMDNYAINLQKIPGLFPMLTEIIGSIREDACFEEILGRALLKASAPSKLTVSNLHAAESSSSKTHPFSGYLPMQQPPDYSPYRYRPFRKTPNSLTKALALGRLPMLENLQICEHIWKL